MDLRRELGTTPVKQQGGAAKQACLSFPSYFGAHCCLCPAVITTAHSPTKAKKKNNRGTPININIEWLSHFQGVQQLYWCNACRSANKMLEREQLEPKIALSIMQRGNRWSTFQAKICKSETLTFLQ